MCSTLHLELLIYEAGIIVTIQQVSLGHLVCDCSLGSWKALKMVSSLMQIRYIFSLVGNIWFTL